MKPGSRRIIHMGINFITVPPPVIDTRGYLDFQGELIGGGLEFDRVARETNKIIVTRQAPRSLQVTIATVEPQPGAGLQMGQALIVAPQPNRSLGLFIQEAKAAVAAFNTVWPAANRQVMSCDATLRDLYEASQKHAFKELWEEDLQQPAEALAAFGRPVLGGGLRFVMPPLPDESEPVEIEVKIESYLRDTNKIFIETQFRWNQATARPLNPEERLIQANDYVEKQVLTFLMGEVVG